MRTIVKQGRAGLTAIAALAVVLAGCGSKNENGGGATRPSSTQAASPSTPSRSGHSRPPSSLPLSSGNCTVGAATAGTGLPPWKAPKDASARMQAACLEPLTSEGQVLHNHMLLIVYVDGHRTPVPAELGIDEVARRISAVHTHDRSGVIHVESPTEAAFTLGQVFAEWNVRLTAGALGGLTAGNGKTLRWWVNGTQRSGDPADLRLDEHQIIVLAFGSSGQQVNIPTTYDWDGL